VPIRKELRHFYPIDWPQLSAFVRFVRAGGRCQRCRRPHGRTVRHLGNGRWYDEETATWRDGRGRVVAPPPAIAESRTTRVFLAAAHRDHDPGNCRPRNLRALCQRCHILHDRPEHLRRRRLTYLRRRALGDLFLGPYRAW
jgi:hypothetical protein